MRSFTSLFLTLLIAVLYNKYPTDAFSPTRYGTPSTTSPSSSSSLYEQKKTATDYSFIPSREGTVAVSRQAEDGTEDDEYNLAYRIFRPMSLSSRQGAPILVLHGGPSVPSDYIHPLVKAVPYRSIVFYDQLGCGDSDEPTDKNAYSIEKALDDLEALIKKLSLRRFHLYGQSFGGILAYEYLKRLSERKDDIITEFGEGCLSVILSSSPCNVKQVEDEAGRLIEQLETPELFRETHQCRTPEMPDALQEAYDKAGTVWRGTTAISDYVATSPSEDAARMPSCMVMRGEHDFVTQACVEDWKSLLNSRSVRYRTLDGCSHHGLLENPTLYGDIVDSFYAEYD